MKRPPWAWPVIEAPAPGAAPAPWWSRLAWLVGIWVLSTGALLLVALLIRWVLKP